MRCTDRTGERRPGRRSGRRRDGETCNPLCDDALDLIALDALAGHCPYPIRSMASRSLLLRLVASRLPRSWRTARRISDPVASASRCPPRREGAPAAGCRGCWVRTLNRLVRPEGHDRRRNPLGTQRNPRRDAGGAKTAPGTSRCNFGPPPAVRARSPPSTRPKRVTIPIGTPPFVDLPRKSLLITQPGQLLLQRLQAFGR